MDARVLEQMLPYFGGAFGNPHASDHVLGWKAAEAVGLAAHRVATLIGADTDEIVFTSGATEANNLSLLGLARRAANGPRRRILMSPIEHKCVLAVGRAIERQYGIAVEFTRIDAFGRVDLGHLEERIADDVLAVSVMAVNNEIGTIQDIGRISEITRASGAIFHCDGAQAPCALDMSQFADQIDMISLSAHKMYGPMGIGALYVRRDLQDFIEPVIYGGGQQNNLRSGTLPTPLCVGMGVAATLRSGEREFGDRKQVAQLRDRFVKNLITGPYQVTLNGPPSGAMRHPGNANVSFERFLAQDILGALQPDIAASSGAACTSGFQEPSHVLQAIGLTSRQADRSIRFSLGYGTTEEEVDAAVQLIERTLFGISNDHLCQV